MTFSVCFRHFWIQSSYINRDLRDWSRWGNSRTSLQTAPLWIYLRQHTGNYQEAEQIHTCLAQNVSVRTVHWTVTTNQTGTHRYELKELSPRSYPRRMMFLAIWKANIRLRGSLSPSIDWTKPNTKSAPRLFSSVNQGGIKKQFYLAFCSINAQYNNACLRLALQHIGYHDNPKHYRNT